MLQLFVREGCHLCDEALDLLETLGIEAEQVDIGADLQLELRYGLRIPVLAGRAAGHELDWPFDAHRVHEWLSVDRA